jgi:hypothetical protein
MENQGSWEGDRAVDMRANRQLYVMETLLELLGREVLKSNRFIDGKSIY